MAEQVARAADWLTIHEALARILDSVRPLPPENVPLLEAVGRTLAEDVVSPIDHPPWDNSAMDGYAARAQDVRGAGSATPVVLRLLEEVPAGGFPTRPLGAGETTKIMTGAPIPDGADSVIRLEHTRQEGDRVVVLADTDAGRNLRRRGEDLRAGARLFAAGRVLRGGEIGVLAACGRPHVRVHRRPRVAILSTGDELVDLDRFDEARAGRKIVNSNSYALAASVLASGCTPVLLGIARDERTDLREHLQRAFAADVLVTSAGASVGEHDLVKDVLRELGFRLDFWRVRIRPGSPFSFGMLPRPSATAPARTPAPAVPAAAAVPTPEHTPDYAPQALPVFGLPGNPVSALVTFQVLVRPALRRMLGRRALHNVTLRVRAAERITTRPGLVQFLRARLEPDPAGRWQARLTGPQGSGIQLSMALADALLILPEDAEVVEAGQELLAMPLWPVDAASEPLPP
ncbi:MAG: molybdopterin molybdotransferase MoeA [Gemmatimonadetes bacterium]|nr:molybdopterin molybdotransferase MoeA [Gemmatimonadota bacterium]